MCIRDSPETDLTPLISLASDLKDTDVSGRIQVELDLQKLKSNPSLNTILQDGDEIIIPEPFYANYNGFSVANGVKIVPIFSSIDDNFSLPNIEEFENLITDKTKAILICNPNNPTGYVYSKEELKRLIKIVKKHNLFLIVDEVYREFTYDGISHTSVMEFDEISENAIVIDSVSKRYSMCGARIGCIISKNKEFLI